MWAEHFTHNADNATRLSWNEIKHCRLETCIHFDTCLRLPNWSQLSNSPITSSLDRYLLHTKPSNALPTCIYIKCLMKSSSQTILYQVRWSMLASFSCNKKVNRGTILQKCSKVDRHKNKLINQVFKVDISNKCCNIPVRQKRVFQIKTHEVRFAELQSQITTGLKENSNVLVRLRWFVFIRGHATLLQIILMAIFFSSSFSCKYAIKL